MLSTEAVALVVVFRKVIPVSTAKLVVGGRVEKGMTFVGLDEGNPPKDMESTVVEPQSLENEKLSMFQETLVCVPPDSEVSVVVQAPVVTI
jgi:hypothetical protein